MPPVSPGLLTVVGAAAHVTRAKSGEEILGKCLFERSQSYDVVRHFLLKSPSLDLLSPCQKHAALATKKAGGVAAVAPHGNAIPTFAGLISKSGEAVRSPDSCSAHSFPSNATPPWNPAFSALHDALVPAPFELARWRSYVSCLRSRRHFSAGLVGSCLPLRSPVCENFKMLAAARAHWRSGAYLCVSSSPVFLFDHAGVPSAWLRSVGVAPWQGCRRPTTWFHRHCRGNPVDDLSHVSPCLSTSLWYWSEVASVPVIVTERPIPAAVGLVSNSHVAGEATTRHDQSTT